MRGPRRAVDAVALLCLAVGLVRARTIDIAGARIETLAWGERGKPGLLLMHGNGAHAQWWSFIAPFFARDWRVVAFSWSGMGRSDRRPSGTYSLDLFVDEAFSIAQAEGISTLTSWCWPT